MEMVQLIVLLFVLNIVCPPAEGGEAKEEE
jgi:hypothetical protein